VIVLHWWTKEQIFRDLPHWCSLYFYSLLLWDHILSLNLRQGKPYRFVYWYNYHDSVCYPSSCLLFKTQLRSIDLPLLHRKHYVYAHESNRLMISIGLWRWYNYHNSGYYPSSCLSTQVISSQVILRPTVSRPFYLGVGHPSWTRDQFFLLLPFIIVRQLRIQWYGTPSLTRSRVCSFHFLLWIASTAFLRPECHRTHEHILLSLLLRLP
jgi:hypothetical protein